MHDAYLLLLLHVQREEECQFSNITLCKANGGSYSKGTKVYEQNAHVTTIMAAIEEFAWTRLQKQVVYKNAPVVHSTSSCCIAERNTYSPLPPPLPFQPSFKLIVHFTNSDTISWRSYATYINLQASEYSDLEVRWGSCLSPPKYKFMHSALSNLCNCCTWCIPCQYV